MLKKPLFSFHLFNFSFFSSLCFCLFISMPHIVYAANPTINDCQQINSSGTVQCTLPVAHGWQTGSTTNTYSTYQAGLDATLAYAIQFYGLPAGSVINYGTTGFSTFVNESDGNQQSRFVWVKEPDGTIFNIGVPLNYTGFCANAHSTFQMKTLGTEPTSDQQYGPYLSNGLCVPQTQTETSCPDGKSCYGDVDVSSGSATEMQNDYTDSSIDPLYFSRYYSTNTQQWNNTYTRQISAGTDTNANQYVAITGPTGKTNTYSYDSTQQAWIPANASTVERLVQIKDNTGNPTGWLYTQRDNSVEQYDSNNRLVSIKQPQGSYINLAYDSLGRISTVTNDQNKSLNLTYQNNSLPVNLSNITNYSGYLNALNTLTTPGNQTYQYSYDSNYNLTGVTPITLVILIAMHHKAPAFLMPIALHIKIMD